MASGHQQAQPTSDRRLFCAVADEGNIYFASRVSTFVKANGADFTSDPADVRLRQKGNAIIIDHEIDERPILLPPRHTLRTAVHKALAKYGELWRDGKWVRDDHKAPELKCIDWLRGEFGKGPKALGKFRVCFSVKELQAAEKAVGEVVSLDSRSATPSQPTASSSTVTRPIAGRLPKPLGDKFGDETTLPKASKSIPVKPRAPPALPSSRWQRQATPSGSNTRDLSVTASTPSPFLRAGKQSLKRGRDEESDVDEAPISKRAARLTTQPIEVEDNSSDSDEPLANRRKGRTIERLAVNSGSTSGKAVMGGSGDKAGVGRGKGRAGGRQAKPVRGGGNAAAGAIGLAESEAAASLAMLASRSFETALPTSTAADSQDIGTAPALETPRETANVELDYDDDDPEAVFAGTLKQDTIISELSDDQLVFELKSYAHSGWWTFGPKDAFARPRKNPPILIHKDTGTNIRFFLGGGIEKSPKDSAERTIKDKLKSDRSIPVVDPRTATLFVIRDKQLPRHPGDQACVEHVRRRGWGHVVTAAWLVACFEAGEVCKIADFEVDVTVTKGAPSELE